MKKLSRKELEKKLKDEALKIAVACVRNTIIEKYHCGITPESKTGDYTDVKVVTPYGDISWNELSRISDEEMKAFNRDVVNKLYVYLHHSFNSDCKKCEKIFFSYFNAWYPNNWDEPKLEGICMECREI